MMRYWLYDSYGRQIGLEQEIEYLKNYISLQILRFGDELRFNLFISGKSGGFLIEPMLLIPFVENAFKHGIGDLNEPIKDVSLEIHENERKLNMIVMNNISKPSNTRTSDSGIGLANVRRRLELLYPGKHLMIILQKESLFTINLEIVI